MLGGVSFLWLLNMFKGHEDGNKEVENAKAVSMDVREKIGTDVERDVLPV